MQATWNGSHFTAPEASGTTPPAEAATAAAAHAAQEAPSDTRSPLAKAAAAARAAQEATVYAWFFRRHHQGDKRADAEATELEAIADLLGKCADALEAGAQGKTISAPALATLTELPPEQHDHEHEPSTHRSAAAKEPAPP
jgi:hypothetical protein